MPLSLTKPQIDSFQNQGYLVVEDVLPPALLAEIRAEYSARLAQLYDGWHRAGQVPKATGFFDQLRAAYSAGCDWFQPLDISLPDAQIASDTPMHTGPAVFDMMTHEGLLDIVEDLIGPEITSCPIQHVRIKPPARKLDATDTRAHVASTDWHQDRAVGSAEADETRMLTVWIAITDATPDNGCLQVQPGPSDMLPHCPLRQTAIPEAFLAPGTAKPVPVRAGGAVLLHPLTPHASLENHSDGFRWSFDIRYTRTGDPTGRAQFPDFVARSRSAPETELGDCATWQALWHDTRARLASVPHKPFHRWRSDSPACA